MRNREHSRPQTTPAFLERLRARAGARPPRWLDWHFASMLSIFIVMAALVWLLSPILAPFLAAAILAYIFDPVADRLVTAGLSRTMATIITIVGFLLVVVLLLLIVLPLFYKEVSQLAELLPGFVEQLKTSAIPWLNEKLGVSITLDPASFRQFVTDNAADASGIARKVATSVGTGGLAVVGFLINLLLVPIVLFYVLRDWDDLIAKIDALIPGRLHATVTTVAREIDDVLSEFLRGQLLVMLIMALFYVIALWAVGLRFALPVGLITGLLVFVPYLGSGMGLLLGSVAAVMQLEAGGGMTLVLMVWGVFAVGQLLEGFVVTPWLVGDRIGLHPVVVMFALLAFGQLFGFFGLLLALPVSAAILVGLRHLQARYKLSRLYGRATSDRSTSG